MEIWIACVSCTIPPFTTYFQWPALFHFLFHKYHISIYWFCILIHLSGDRFLKQWVFCFRLDNQCHYALLAQIYHVCLLLLFQIEMGTFLILISGGQFLTWWVFCFKLDNQCRYTLLAQIYHVCLLLLLQIEIARCLIIIIMGLMKHLLPVLYGVGYLIMMSICMNLWSKPSGWWTLWISSSLLTQIYHYKGQYHSDKNVTKYI